MILTEQDFLCRALGATGGPAKAGCRLTTARRALVAGGPRPEAETGRRTAPYCKGAEFCAFTIGGTPSLIINRNAASRVLVGEPKI